MAKQSFRAYLLKKGKAAVKAALLPLKEDKDKHSLQGWLLKRKEELANLEVKIQEAFAEETLDPDKILDAMDAVDVLEDRIERGDQLYKKLFMEEYVPDPEVEEED